MSGNDATNFHDPAGRPDGTATGSTQPQPPSQQQAPGAQPDVQSLTVALADMMQTVLQHMTTAGPEQVAEAMGKGKGKQPTALYYKREFAYTKFPSYGGQIKTLRTCRQEV